MNSNNLPVKIVQLVHLEIVTLENKPNNTISQPTSSLKVTIALDTRH